MRLRLWRRESILPGVRVNVSRSGPSLSLGPRGAHVTVGPNGTRETVGLPGSGLFLTETQNGRPGPSVAPVGASGLDYAAAVGLGIAIAAAALAGLVSPGTAILAGIITAVVGVILERWGHHHPVGARRLASGAAGVLVIFAVAGLALLGAALVAGRRSSRR